MYRPQKQGPPPPLKLTKLNVLPGFEDIFHCLQECQKNRGRLVELPWVAEKPAKDCTITAVADHGSSEPTWSFYTGEGPYREQKWTYQSGDIGLITNLIMRECLGDDTDTPSIDINYSSRANKDKSQDDSDNNPQSSASRTTEAQKKDPDRQATLEGDLQKMKPASLLQSIAISKMTGLLCVNNKEEKAEIFFEEGQPTHAQGSDAKGEGAIKELLTWECGSFAFYPDDRSTDRSIFKRTEQLLMEAAPLIDQFRFLNQTNISMNTYFIRKCPNLSEVEFEQRVSRGAKVDLLKQKQLYQLIDNQSNLFDILRKMPLTKAEWIPAIYNFIVCDLVVLSGHPAHVKKVLPIEAMGIDRSAISVAMKNMLRQETGLINYPVILYFLEQEFFRWEHTGAPFCLIIFEMRKNTGNGLEQLSVASIKEAAKRIEGVKRNIDLLAHFETLGFMVLLPYTRIQAATLVARRISEVLWQSEPDSRLDSNNLALAIGVAGIPEDCQDLGMLLSTAKEALKISKTTGNTVVTLGNLE